MALAFGGDILAGSTVIHYYASLTLIALWQKAREASPTHAEFMPSLCSHPALERFFDHLGLQRFVVETARLKTPARRTKVETMQAITGYLFIARGDIQAQNFFQTLRRTLAEKKHVL